MSEGMRFCSRARPNCGKVAHKKKPLEKSSGSTNFEKVEKLEKLPDPVKPCVHFGFPVVEPTRIMVDIDRC